MVFAIPVILIVPMFVLWLQKKLPKLGFFGPIAICYLIGFIISFIPIGYDKETTQTIASILVAIAIPIILMSLDLTKVRSLVKSFVIGYGAQLVSVILVVAIAVVIATKCGLIYPSQLAGMATGLYSGGTPNLVAVGNALLPFSDAAEIITDANTADFLVGGCYFLLLLTVMKPIYRKLLKGKDSQPISTDASQVEEEPIVAAESEYSIHFLKGDAKGIGKLIAIFFLGIVVLAIGAGLEILINGDLSGSMYLMITVSVLGLALSFVRPIREVKGSYQLGQYLVLAFSLGLSMSIDFHVMIASALPILAFFAAVQTSIVIVHMILCRILKIDAGTALITSVAGLYGPPFISPVAQAWGDKNLIAPGIICGVLGLAIGNLLGIGVGMLLAMI